MPTWLTSILFSRTTWAIAGLLAIVGGLVWWGYDWASDKCEAEKAAAVAEVEAEAAKVAKKDAKTIEDLLARQPEVRIVYRRIKNELETTPLPDCDLPYRARELWNAANAGRFPEDTENPGRSLRTPIPPHWGDLQPERSAEESHRGDGDVHADVP